MYSVFLSSYTNTCESLGELEKAVETLACGSCSHSISRSPKLPLDRNTVHVFYFLNRLNLPAAVQERSPQKNRPEGGGWQKSSLTHTGNIAHLPSQWVYFLSPFWQMSVWQPYFDILKYESFLSPDK